MAMPSLASLGHTITEKLTRDNFLVWKAQVLLHVRAAAMKGYLDGSIEEPAAVIVTEKETNRKKEITETPNPEHAIWVTQDQQVLTFLLASLSHEVLMQVSNHTTAAGVWQALVESFSAQSRARQIQLRSAIGNARKGDLSTSAYFMKMKGLADELAAAGKPLEEDDIISHILEGLMHEPDYNGFVTSISTRAVTDQPIGLSELFSLLLAAESRIAAQHAAYTAHHSANLAAKGGRGGYGGGRGGQGSGHGGYSGGNYADNSGNAGGGGAPRQQGGDRGNRERCQICKEEGHGAWRCRKRFDKSYNNNVRNPAGGGGRGGSGRGGGGSSDRVIVRRNWRSYGRWNIKGIFFFLSPRDTCSLGLFLLESPMHPRHPCFFSKFLCMSSWQNVFPHNGNGG